ncbi:Uncharacterised protein [uncultured archaeon]|nr:Uncharacterised protein [uncultured archaeon]
MDTYTLVIGIGTIILGLALTRCGYTSLFNELKCNTRSDASLSLTAIKSAYTLVVGGLLVIILGVLYLMGIIPWYKT